MEEKLNKVYNLIVIVLIITGLNSLLILSMFNSNHEDMKVEQQVEQNITYDTSKFKHIKGSDMKTLFSAGKHFVYVGRKTCPHCVHFSPVLNKSVTKFNYTLHYLDIEKITEDEYNMIRTLDPFLEKNFGSTPMVIVIDGGKIIDKVQGNIPENDYYNFLKNNNVKEKWCSALLFLSF